MANTRVTTPVTDFDKISVTQGLKLPSGTNTNQPAGAAAEQGMIRNDTEETVDSSASAIAHYNGTNWQYFAATESADPLGPLENVYYLIVAGGAAGGNFVGGGGGAGGLLTNYNGTAITLQPSTDYTITVGEGGASHTTSQWGAVPPSADGNDSKFSTFTAIGGGGGGNYADSTVAMARDGGSGGGGGITTTSGGAFVAGGTGILGQGHDGGDGEQIVANARYSAGGGGGSTGAGITAATGKGGNGGSGTSINILNSTNASAASVGEVISSNVYYSGGGGGGNEAQWSSGSAGTGGNGGGGNGSNSNASQAGTPLTGGGGGGKTWYQNSDNNSGGSGVVILRYPNTHTLSVDVGLTQSSGSPFTEGTENVSVFTGGTGNISFI